MEFTRALAALRRGTLHRPISRIAQSSRSCATRQLDGWCALHRRARAAGARLAEAKLRVVLHVSRVVCVCVCPCTFHACMATKGLRLSGGTAFYIDVTVIYDVTAMVH